MNYSFNSEKHGYCRKEVDAFISESEKKLDELKAEISTLKTRLDEKEKAGEDFAKKQLYIEDTIVDAQIMADNIIKNAEREAKDLRERIRRESDEARERNESLARELDQKRNECENSLKRIKKILQSQLSLLENNMENDGQ